MSAWKKISLSEGGELVAGFAFKSRDFVSSDDRVIKITNIEDSICGETLPGVDISHEDFARLQKYKVAEGDYVIAMTGSIGKIGRVTSGCAYINQRVCTLRPYSGVDKKFLYYVIKTKDFLSYMLTHIDSHSVQANISAGTIGEYEFSLPPLPTQKKIAAVLSSLDDKIENNRKICKNLEEQAQAIFKSWFVDFEPFGGKMPKGWKMGRLGDIAEYDNRRIAVSELSVESYYSTENMLADRGGVVAASSLPENGEVPRCDEGAVLVSNIRPYFKKIHRVSETGGHSADVLCFVAREPAMKWYLYRLLWDDVFFAYVMSGVKGCKMPRGDKEQIMEYGCVRPNGKTLSEFNAALEPICRKVALCCNESRALAELRDALLPKLMAGEIDVDRVEVA